MEYNSALDSTICTIAVSAKQDSAYEIMLVEYIPKIIAPSAADINFTREPDEILNDDPIVMWHLLVADQTVNISYMVAGNFEASESGTAFISDMSEGFDFFRDT